MVLITLQKKEGMNAAVKKVAIISQPRGGDCREEASPHPPQHPQRSPYQSRKALPSCLVQQTLGPWEPVAILQGLLAALLRTQTSQPRLHPGGAESTRKQLSVIKI